MAKGSRSKPNRSATEVVAPRQPCPCGSGRRYKACHGGDAGEVPYVVRTFAGLPGECDWVAMREFVPAATAPLRLRPDAYDGTAAERDVTVATVLPGVAPAQVRADGAVWIAVQVAHQSGDPSQDLAEALRLGLSGSPGTTLVMPTLPGRPGLRLQDVVDTTSSFDVTVFSGFDFWFEDQTDPDGSVAATLEKLNSSIHPTSRLHSVEAAYWTSVGTKEHLRWVLPHDEDAALTALARLHARGADSLGSQSRLVGSFRAHGLLVPVWDLPLGTGADVLEEPAAGFAERLGEALADTGPLSTQVRSARSGLANRQVTIR